MPKLVDTTIRVLSQEPLAGTLPTAELLRLAEILDGAGYACLEISGGGAFDAAPHRRVERPAPGDLQGGVASPVEDLRQPEQLGGR